MISIQIIDIKQFMEHLFKNNTFDEFEISGIDIKALSDLKISGTLNKSFLTSDEKEIVGYRHLILWREIKPSIFSFIKGNKKPLLLKIIFSLSINRIEQLIATSNAKIDCTQVNGLYLNITYDDKGLYCTTGSSLKVFSMDKSLDINWDNYVKDFFLQNNMLYE